VSNHRADKRAVTRRDLVDGRGASDGGSAGRRRAVKSRGTHGGLRKTLIPGLPSAPTLVGVAAMVAAAAGAVTVAPAAPAERPEAAPVTSTGTVRLTGQASVLTGDSQIASTSALAGRARAVSRDSQREALQDAADQELQAAAEKQAKERNAALAALAASAEKQAGLIARNNWQLPVRTGLYHLTSTFGECSSLWSHCHTGLDFAAPTGTPISAVAAGTVSEVGDAGAYGNRTIVTLEDGTETWYCHQSAYAVSVGQKVRAGEVIGAVGATGNTTGPHLHLEVRPGAGDPVDPFSALTAHGLTP
jgi:murein DD-endopeptidase MepM/ murein hydrolase activator NlpD